jgi:hypothetical protein
MQPISCGYNPNTNSIEAVAVFFSSGCMPKIAGD